MEAHPKLSFCVIVPMYNEGGNAERCLYQLATFLQDLEYDTLLVAVNDGSTDRTGEILEYLLDEIEGLVVETHEKNRGYGAANKTGAQRAISEGFGYALFMDSDLTQSVKYIYPFIDEMKKGTDFIKATRYAKGGEVVGVSFSRWFVSRVGNQMAKIALKLPISDYTNGFRAVRTDILSKIDCKENGFPYLIEEVAQATKFAKTFSEIPYTLTCRDNTCSGSKFRYTLDIYYTYFKHLFK